MNARIRTAVVLVVAVVVCAYQWMDITALGLQSPLWPLGALLLLAVVLADNARRLRAAGLKLGLGHGRQLPTAGWNLATTVSVLFVVATLLRGLLA